MLASVSEIPCTSNPGTPPEYLHPTNLKSILEPLPSSRSHAPDISCLEYCYRPSVHDQVQGYKPLTRAHCVFTGMPLDYAKSRKLFDWCFLTPGLI